MAWTDADEIAEAVDGVFEQYDVRIFEKSTPSRTDAEGTPPAKRLLAAARSRCNVQNRTIKLFRESVLETAFGMGDAPPAWISITMDGLCIRRKNPANEREILHPTDPRKSHTIEIATDP